ncbi:hypothetical protein [Streptomyces sp. NBC_01353]|uniref:hypothetical protein n=1 Tax=Streptomyces sp. NBC_01353 TaxID=2903835 RepID=UPI002E35EEF5|nr:hypothetical protein [Streptomyces sp. NBC_01353]
MPRSQSEVGLSTAFTAAGGLEALARITAVAVIRFRKSDLDALSGKAEATDPAVQGTAGRSRSAPSP